MGDPSIKQEQDNNSIIVFNSIYNELQQLVKQDKYIEFFDKGESIEDKINIKYEDALAYQILKAFVLNRKGDPSTGLPLAQNILKESEHIANPILIVNVSIAVVEGMRRMGMPKNALVIIQKAEIALENL